MLCVVTAIAHAQERKAVDSLTFDKPITDYSIDVSGNIYVALEGGSITKYSPELDSLFTYSPVQVGNVKLLEAGNGLRIFAFYDYYQEYLITDRFLTQPVRAKFSSATLDFVEIASQSQDNNIWLVENSGLRLVKYSPATQTILTETFLSSIVDSRNPSFSFVKEYQNQVFLVDKNSGIYVFDNLGNFSRKIPVKTDKCLFYSTKITYVQGNELIVSDLYKQDEIREKIGHLIVKNVMLFKSNVYIIKPQKILRLQ